MSDVGTKHCYNCKQIKFLNEYSSDRSRGDGKAPMCKVCTRFKRRQAYQKSSDKICAQKRARYATQAEHVRKLRKAAYQKNKEKLLAYHREWRQNHAESCKVSYKKWQAANKERVALYSANRRARIKNAQPRWLTENDLKWIAWHYDHAQKMTEITGTVHHVDHIHPLQGKTFRGLHVPWNLQVIPAHENVRKGARYEAVDSK